MTDLHVITERADGPDLDDLVRLIRYLREHDIRYTVSDDRAKRLPDDVVPWMTVEFEGPRLNVYVHESASGAFDGKSLPSVVLVGPDGTVYDANREAL